MNEVKIKFIANPLYSIACINTEERVMYLRINAIMNKATDIGMTFDDLFALCVSHELIHQLLFDMEGDSTSDAFDNICYKEYKDIKHWIGGVGGK